MRFKSWYPPGALSLVVLIPFAPLSAQAPSGDPAFPAGYPVADTPPVAVTRAVGAESDSDRTRGALWGAGIGLVAGGLLGGLTVESDDGDDGFGGSLAEGTATGEAVVTGALVGAAIGALLGATVFAPSRRAAGTPGREPALLVSPSVTRTGVGVSARLLLWPGTEQE